MNKNAFPCESPFVLFECVFKGCNTLCVKIQNLVHTMYGWIFGDYYIRYNYNQT